MFSLKWHKRFFTLAATVAQWSKDPNTKVGAVLVRPDKSIASVGFNGFPPGVRDSEDRLNTRSTKNRIVRHAEENCINFCRDEDMSGHTLYLWPPNLVPCTRCSGLVIMKGIKNIAIAVVKEDESFNEEWREDNVLAAEMLGEAGVRIHRIE